MFRGLVSYVTPFRLCEGGEAVDEKVVTELRTELWEKERKLTDIRLEALSSAHQLEQLQEAMNSMQVYEISSSSFSSFLPLQFTCSVGTVLRMPKPPLCIKSYTICTLYITLRLYAYIISLDFVCRGLLRNWRLRTTSWRQVVCPPAHLLDPPALSPSPQASLL